MIKRLFHAKLCLAASLTLAALHSPRALATLGGSVDSIEADTHSLAGEHVDVVNHPHYAVHQIKTGAFTLKEFVNSSGQVFGIAWSGHTHPRLDKLLGRYAQEYSSANARTAKVRGARRRTVKSENVVVNMWGNQRHLQGYAYLSSLIPNGVSVNEIR